MVQGLAKRMRMMEPKQNDMAHVGWLLSVAFTVGIILASLVCWLTPAEAVVTNGYYVLSTISRGFDTWTVTSCSLFVVGGWDLTNPDSTRGFTTLMVDGPNAYGFDTLARFAIIAPSQLDDDNNAQFYVVWRLSDGRVVRDNTPQVTHMTSFVDYIRTAVSASANVDYDSLVDVLAAEFGPGPWGSGAGTGIYSDSILVLRTSDNTPIGAGVQVKLVPNGGGTFLQQANTANGWAKFSVNADTFFVYLWTPGYYQQTVPETNEVPATNTKDTVYMVQVTPASPSAPGLTSVSFTFYNGLGTPIKNVIVRYNLESKSTTAYHVRDSSIIFDPSQIFEARSATNGTATINVTPNDSIRVLGGQTGKTNWRVKAYTPDGLIPLLGTDGVSLTVPASLTGLIYPQDWE